MTILCRFSNSTSVPPHEKAWFEGLKGEANRRVALRPTVKAKVHEVIDANTLTNSNVQLYKSGGTRWLQFDLHARLPLMPRQRLWVGAFHHQGEVVVAPGWTRLEGGVGSGVQDEARGDPQRDDRTLPRRYSSSPKGSSPRTSR